MSYNKTIIYTDIRKKYYSGGPTEIDFDFDNTILTDVEIENHKELIAYLMDSTPVMPIKGSIYTLTYIGATNESLMFEGGFKDYVRVEKKQSELKYFKSLQTGDLVDMLISNVNNKKFLIEGSVAQLYETRAHDTVKALKEEENILALIKEITPAGFNVELQYDDTIILPGFMPNTLAGINKLTDPETLVGKTLEVMIESFSKDEGTYIVSRRKYLQSLIPEAIKELKTNTVYTGYVTGTAEFGIFIEFGIEGHPICMTGLLHKTNIDPEWQDKLHLIPSGYEIQFYVKEIIKDTKIILTQILRDNLWDTIKIGQIIEGKVKDNKQFGSLIWLDDNQTLGLIHNTELEKANKSFNIGQTVKVKVLAIDRGIRKIYLAVA